MAIQDTLSDIWHDIEDKAWNLADFLEDKGVPLASFCENNGISPVLLILAIVLVAVFLVAVLGGAGGPAGTAKLAVYVKDTSGNPISVSVTVAEVGGGYSDTEKTSMDSGRVNFEGLAMNKDYKISITDERYKTERTVKITKDAQEETFTVEVQKGTLEVTVTDDMGADVEEGSITVRDMITDEVVGSKQLDGSSKYSFELPAGVYSVVLESTSGGQLDQDTKQVLAGQTATADFKTSTGAVNSGTVVVTVKDEAGNAVVGATVVLYNFRNDYSMGDPKTTDSSGEATFSNIALQTSVYPTVFPNDNRYGSIDKYTGREDHRITVSGLSEHINVTLQLNGRVDVLVWDKDTSSRVAGASVVLKNKAGELMTQETKNTDSDGKVSFAGLEENVEVYPVVTAIGYLEYGDESDSMIISYDHTTSFSVPLERDASAQLSVLTVTARDGTYGDPLTGFDLLLSDTDGNVVKVMKGVDKADIDVDANKMYNLAIHKKDFKRVVIEGITAGTKDVELERANAASAGEAKVCTYIHNVDGQESPASSEVSLHLSHGTLVDVGMTAGGDDGDNCISFADLPLDWSVYASAKNDGYEEVESGVEQVTARQDGVILMNISLDGIQPNVGAVGDVYVCVKDEKNNALAGADVLLYDADMNGPGWDGDYRKTTDSSGCALFNDIPSKKTNTNGALVDMRVYAIISADGYAVYNGLDEGNTITVQPARSTPLNVRLSAGQDICISVKSDGEAVDGATVSLCANAPCTQVLETKGVDADGHAIFSSDVKSVRVKVVTNKDKLTKEKIADFPLSAVTGGQCGEVDISQVKTYATVTLDLMSGSFLEVAPMTNQEIQFIVKVDNALATGGAISSGGQNVVRGPNGEQVLVSLEGDYIEPGTIRTVDATEGKYAIPFITPSDEKDYRVSLKVSILDCDTCQGDERIITLRITDGDDDNDGVLDEDDNCPRTPQGVVVDMNGCPLQDVSTSAPEQDSDGDGIPDNYDAEPADPTEMYPNEDKNNNNMPDAYESPQNYENSVEVCVESSGGEPIYGNSVGLYYSASGNAGGQPAGGYGAYGRGNAYTQPWQIAYSHDNCKVYVGYSPFQTLSASSFMSSFYLVAGAGRGYSQYDSRTGGNDNIEISWGGPGGMMRVIVKLKSTGQSVTGEPRGTYSDPLREVELVGDDWDSSGEVSGIETLYPLVTDVDRDIHLTIRYTIEDGAPDNIKYTIKYSLSGGHCYEVEGVYETYAVGGRFVTFRKGERSVEDDLVIYAKGECWEANNNLIENDIRLMISGNLAQIGDKEGSVNSPFTMTAVDIKPLVGAVDHVYGVSDLADLSDKMQLRYGVATLGSLPYCVSKDGNTGATRLKNRGPTTDEGQAAARHKIIIEFEGRKDFPSMLDNLADKIGDYIQKEKQRAPLDCRAYVTVSDENMGHVKVGEEGRICDDAKVQQGASLVEPWQKLFCGALQGHTEGGIPLSGTYTMETDTQ